MSNALRRVLRRAIERHFLGEYPDACPILANHVSIDHHPRARAGIIPVLTVLEGGNAVAWALLCGFESEPNAGMKWVICNAIPTVMNRTARKRQPSTNFPETLAVKMALLMQVTIR